MQSFLIVEDCRSLASSLSATLSGRPAEVRVASSVTEAQHQLADFSPEFMLLDLALPDGTGFDVLRILQNIRPTPTIIVMSGCASPSESFQLAEFAVSAYLPKPITPVTLEGAINRAVRGVPKIVPHLRALVGKRGLSEVEDEVRETMLLEALAKARGSRRRAATFLSVSRQLLQHMLKKATDR